MTTLFVGNLSTSATAQRLDELFSFHGPVCRTKVVVDQASLKCRGFGFVTMLHRKDAEAAMASLNGAEVDGRLLRVAQGINKCSTNGRNVLMSDSILSGLTNAEQVA